MSLLKGVQNAAIPNEFSVQLNKITMTSSFSHVHFMENKKFWRENKWSKYSCIFSCYALTNRKSNFTRWYFAIDVMQNLHSDDIMHKLNGKMSFVCFCRWFWLQNKGFDSFDHKKIRQIDWRPTFLVTWQHILGFNTRK